ncbi:hypothetical protein QBC47DRAFT_308533 [Echria macrotheca]|uniref:Secreted protein n=1 Tax=Echria macrotheca TaxID=438768 RepID=A0AAJ0F1B3_9PEZI|nr:hypothetical protein QBC47DRAFT_308533 [Echria macrotheca]
MKFLTSLLFTSALGLATPVIRQTQPAQIISASVVGEGCPQGSFSTEISDDGQTISYGWDNYDVAVGPGADPNGREKTCDITLRINFPLGCTSARFSNTYHGFAQLDQGVTGTFSTQYNISPGQLVSGGNPPPATVSASGFGGAGNVYTKSDVAVGKINANAANQQVVTYIARTRMFVQGSNNTVFGTLSDDDYSFSITQQSRCW